MSAAAGDAVDDDDDDGDGVDPPVVRVRHPATGRDVLVVSRADVAFLAAVAARSGLAAASPRTVVAIVHACAAGCAQLDVHAFGSCVRSLVSSSGRDARRRRVRRFVFRLSLRAT